MKLLEEKILEQGEVLPGEVLKVGSFLNQQIDPALLKAMGEEIARLFSNDKVTKILTVEASGIAIAASAAIAMNLPMVFAKKHHTANVSGDFYSAKTHSYTHNLDYNMIVSANYLSANDNVLIVDDFLAIGAAVNGMLELVHQAGANVAGISCAIEKGFQGGGDKLREAGYKVESLAVIESMTDSSITFRK